MKVDRFERCMIALFLFLVVVETAAQIGMARAHYAERFTYQTTAYEVSRP